jgi:hypothetical protein
MTVTLAQCLLMVARERSLGSFTVQLRVAYLLLLLVCDIPSMQCLYWLPLLGTLALVVFDYCLLARVLSLAPWNCREAYSLDLLKRTFLSAPDLSRLQPNSTSSGCAAGLCTIEAQVAPGGSQLRAKTENHAT